MAVTRLRPVETLAQKKAERNRRLLECDWTQLPDSPLLKKDQDAWKKYRKELRDIKFDGTWPVTPDQKKASPPARKKPTRKKKD